jgi:hypothetical protein
MGLKVTQTFNFDKTKLGKKLVAWIQIRIDAWIRI